MRCLLLLCLSLVPAWAADDFPPITDEQRALTEVVYQPGAPAVILDHRAYFSTDRARGTMKVSKRIKILTEEGSEYGEYTFNHSRRYPLRKLKARTVLPDGTIIPVPDEAIFERVTSQSERIYETVITFPRVEPGVILDYRFETLQEAILFPEWIFQGELPVEHSEITYNYPNTWTLQPWSRSASNVQVETEFSRVGDYAIYRAWSDGLPGVPNEPLDPPHFDKVAIFKFLFVRDEIAQQPVFANWSTSCKLWDRLFYKEARRKSKRAKKKAASIAANHEAPLDQAKAIYRYVRDSIQTLPRWGTVVDKEGVPDAVLKEGRGSHGEKAFLAHQMLLAIDPEATLVWARDRYEGMGSRKVYDPFWFDTMFVRVTIDDESYLLDVNDPDLPFGRIPYAYEGTLALIYRTKGPELLNIPEAAADRNARRASIQLEIDDEGRASMTGRVTLSGHAAWAWIDRDRPEPQTASLFAGWLQDRLPGFEIGSVTTATREEAQEIEVRWTAGQSDEELLGDEASLMLSRPFGPSEQRFELQPQLRQLPVLLRFAYHDELELTIAWPEGWELDITPSNRELESEAGALKSTLEVDEAARTLSFSRRLTVNQRTYNSGPEYAGLRALYAEAQRADAQELVLIAP